MSRQIFQAVSASQHLLLSYRLAPALQARSKSWHRTCSITFPVREQALRNNVTAYCCATAVHGTYPTHLPIPSCLSTTNKTHARHHLVRPTLLVLLPTLPKGRTSKKRYLYTHPNSLHSFLLRPLIFRAFPHLVRRLLLVGQGNQRVRDATHGSLLSLSLFPLLLSLSPSLLCLCVSAVLRVSASRSNERGPRTRVSGVPGAM